MEAITEKEIDKFMSTVKTGDWYVKEYIGMSDNSWGRKAVKHKGGSTVDRAGIPKTSA